MFDFIFNKEICDCCQGNKLVSWTKTIYFSNRKFNLTGNFCSICKHFKVANNSNANWRLNVATNNSSNMIIPEALYAILPNETFTSEQKSLFNEAKLIFFDSPQAAIYILKLMLENAIKTKFNSFEIQQPLNYILMHKDAKTLLGEKLFELGNRFQTNSQNLNHLLEQKHAFEECKLYFHLVNQLVPLFTKTDPIFDKIKRQLKRDLVKIS